MFSDVGRHGFVREAWINWHITRWCWRVKYCCFFTYSAISVNLNLVVYYGFRARSKKILEQSEVCRPHDKGLLTIKKKQEKLVISALAAQCGKVWLTVSSLWRPIAASDKVVDAELEVNWDLDCPSSTGYPDTIKVFTADPAHSNKFCLLLSNVVTKYSTLKITFRIIIFFLPFNFISI